MTYYQYNKIVKRVKQLSVESVNAENEKLISELKQMKINYNEVYDENKNLKKEIRYLKSDKKHIEYDCENLKEENKKLKKKIDDLEKKISGFRK